MTAPRLAAVLLAFAVLVAIIAWLAWQLYALNTALDTACGPGGTVSRLDLADWIGVCQGRGY